MDFVWRLFYQLNEWWILLLQYDSAAPALYCWCDLFIIQRNCVFDLVQWNRKFSGSVSYMCIYFQQQGWLFSSCPAGGRAASLDSPPASLDHIHIPHLLKPRLSAEPGLICVQDGNLVEILTRGGSSPHSEPAQQYITSWMYETGTQFVSICSSKNKPRPL